MNAAPAVDRLQAMEPRLRAAGLTALYLFGSTARGRTSRGSDIDLLFESDRARNFSLIDQAQLQLALSDALGEPVDLIERDALRPSVRRIVEADMVKIF
jgi:predicted nucleotidyltransferase